MSKLYKLLPELREIDSIAQACPDIIKKKTLGFVDCGFERFPIDALVFGPDDPTLPCVVLVGGCPTGWRRIGTQVVLSYLKTITNSLKWDNDLRHWFTNRRLIAIPILNPAGTAFHWRCNPNGVDLMRNSPVEADPDETTWLLSGHRWTTRLPWHRGEEGKLEYENQTIINFFKEEVFPSKTIISMDFHSGFGTQDQIWYPWAKTRKEKFPYYNEFVNLQKLFDNTFPNHIYKIEPQTKNYVTHGDLWDYMLMLNAQRENPSTFIPLTLEIGSWIWVKKNPLQIFSIFGLYNPVKEHRFRRQLRRHIFMLNFLLRAVKNNEALGF
jgi:hypothetical protein